MSRIAIALSGGVDSSLAARLLLNAGHELIAVTMQLQEDTTGQEGCAGNTAVQRAKHAAEGLGIEHHVCDLSQAFRDIILQYSWNSYKNAKTPSPCVFCNEQIKFARLWDFAKAKGCEFLASGHYATIRQQGARHVLCRGADRGKDQSYFLSGLCSELLEHVVFPLGSMCKTEVRRLAESYALFSAKIADSQNVCITQRDCSFAETLAQIFNENSAKGYFIDEQGRKLRPHKGLHHYTVGQRHGLGDLVPTKPVWVKKICSPDVVVTTDPEALKECDCSAHSLVWNCDLVPTRAQAQIRYRHQAQDVHIDYDPSNRTCKLHFEEPVRAVAPGQIVAFYQGDLVLGRGVLGFAD